MRGAPETPGRSHIAVSQITRHVPGTRGHRDRRRLPRQETIDVPQQTSYPHLPRCMACA